MSYIPSRILSIPKTLCIISECWNKAEENLRNDIRNYNPDIDEEGITLFFHSQMSKALKLKSEENAIATAFLDDLKQQLSFLRYRTAILKEYDGLVADITLHNRSTEGGTGGDFGLVIIRPQLELYHSESKTSLKPLRDYQRGILCQAKLKQRNGKWHTPIFGKNQERFLPERLKYLSLLLYSYKDNKRHLLQPFRWQRCDIPSLSFEQIKEWFKKDRFPSLQTSDNILEQLGKGEIGTGDENDLRKFISPPQNRSLIIRIYWPDDKHPGSQVLFTRSTQVKSQVSAAVRK